MKNRLVCDCFNIYVDDIKDAIINGAKSFDELQYSMKLGVMCSACIEDSKAVVEKLLCEYKNISK